MERYEPDKGEFAKRLKLRRRQLRLTQKQLAARIGRSVTMVAYYEQGQYFPGEETLKELCRALNVSAAWLMYETGPKWLKHGRWITQEGRPNGMLYCDRCRKGSGWTRQILTRNGLPDPKYCPWCGSEMMEEER